MIFWIRDPVYGYDPLVAIDETDERVLAAFRKAGYDVDDEFAQAVKVQGNARTGMNFRTGARFMRFRKGQADPGHIAHEAAHMAFMLYDKLKTPVDSANDEPFCYYVQFLVSGVVQGMRRRRK